MNRRHWLFLLLILAVAAGTIRLGLWQLDRLEQRREQNDLIESNLERQALLLSEAPPELSPASQYRPAVARGTFDYQHTFVLVSRSFNNQPGVHLVTPFWIEGSQAAILVDRGWIPYQDRVPEQRAKYQVDGTVEVTGFLRFPEGDSWLSLLDGGAGEAAGSYRGVSIERMGAGIPYPIHPYYLQQSERIEGAGRQPEPNPDLDLGDGPHFGYAIQWFAFAAIAVFGGGYWLFRKLRIGADRGSA